MARGSQRKEDGPGEVAPFHPKGGPNRSINNTTGSESCDVVRVLGESGVSSWQKGIVCVTESDRCGIAHDVEP